MLSNKFLFALPLVVAQSAALSLATTEEKEEHTKADHLKAITDVLQVFYPECEALKNVSYDENKDDLTDNLESIECNESEQSVIKLVNEAHALGYALTEWTD